MTELLLIATIAGERVGIAGAQVESVVEIDAVTPVPRSAPHVAGLAAIRSRVLTVIDCCAALQLGGSGEAGGVRDAVIVIAEGHPYALLVDCVEDVVDCPQDALVPGTALAPGWRRVAKGMVEAGDDLLLLIDAEKMLAGPAAAA